jgi:hypothetical protein
MKSKRLQKEREEICVWNSNFVYYIPMCCVRSYKNKEEAADKYKS